MFVTGGDHGYKQREIRLLLPGKHRRQGKSGLGLDAQRAVVATYLNGGDWQIVDEFTEVESGKKSDRPALDKAPGRGAGAFGFLGCFQGRSAQTPPRALSAPLHHRLEQVPQDVALPEPAMTVAREGGVVRDPAVKSQATKPAIGQVGFIAQPPLGSDTHAVADNQHLHHSSESIEGRPMLL